MCHLCSKCKVLSWFLVIENCPRVRLKLWALDFRQRLPNKRLFSCNYRVTN